MRCHTHNSQKPHKNYKSGDHSSGDGTDKEGKRNPNMQKTITHKTKMEITYQLALALLTIFGLAGAGLALTGKHRDAALWFGFAAAIMGMLSFFAWLQDYLWKEDNETEKLKVATASSQLNQSRPWIAPTLVRLKNPLSVGRGVECEVTFHNGGNSAGVLTRSQGKIRVSDTIEEEQMRIGAIEWGEPSTMVMVPGSNAIGVILLKDALDELHLAKIKAGTFSIFAVGFVDYVDNSQVIHTTEFCFFLKGEAVESGLFSGYRAGNAMK